LTAEIAILNRQAVALAADSAVTVEIADDRKTFNTVNKLFTLSQCAPVGIMIYGGAQVTGVPWETIIKAFRRKLGETRFDTLEMYSSRFIEYLESTPEIFPMREQLHEVFHLASSFFRELLSPLSERVKAAFDEGAGITDKRVQGIVTAVVKEHYEDLKAMDTMDHFSADYIRDFPSAYKHPIDAAIASVFEELPVTATTRKRLSEVVLFLMTKQIFPTGASGIVIAGFGENEYFPGLYQYDVQSVIMGKAKYVFNSSVEIGAGTAASVFPFAQREMVDLFMTGMDPTYREQVEGWIGGFLDGLPATLLEGLSLNGRDAKAVEAALSEVAPSIKADFTKSLNDYAHRNHTDPIVSAVSSLPKEGLAEMAESLVNLTSFKRRVTLDLETVGGPIDVAVISKGDGFIWIKRKHYFDADRNPQFFGMLRRE
jgi:hypothetical protein